MLRRLIAILITVAAAATANFSEIGVYPTFFPHTPRVLSEPPGALSELLEAYSTLRTLGSAALDRERDFASTLALVHPPLLGSAKNLLHYLTMRESDLRIVQLALHHHGVSSLGSMEGHVLPSIDAVLRTIAAVTGITPPPPLSTEPFLQGGSELADHTVQLLGPPPAHSYTSRIMVTLPSEAAQDPALIAGLLQHGMDIARINCAHDDIGAWAAMARHVRAEGAKLGHHPLVSFDLAGPKLRTGPVVPGPAVVHWSPHRNETGHATAAARVRLCLAGSPGCAAEHGGVTVVPLEQQHGSGSAEAFLRAAQPGDHVCFRDASGSHRRLVVEAIQDGAGGLLCSSLQSTHVVAGITLHLHPQSGGARSSAEATAAGGKHHGGKGHRHHHDAHAAAEVAAAPDPDENDDQDGGGYSSPPSIDSASATARIAALPAAPGFLVLTTGDVVRIESGSHAGYAVPRGVGSVHDSTDRLAGIAAVITVDIPQVFSSVRPGHRIFMDDGKFAGVVEAAAPDALTVRLTAVLAGQAKLRAEKGLNLPDTVLDLPGLTDDDSANLDAVLQLQPDIISMSFVQHPQDVLRLYEQLDRAGATEVGVVLKIETRAGFENLPATILTALRRPKVGLMVARGDLGVEVGFSRLSEVQEELLWLGEAARMPVIWATQVLESMAQNGIPTRGDVTDAAFSSRAECTMLNKGPYIFETMAFLQDVLTRMQGHERKKVHLLRRLAVSDALRLHNAVSGLNTVSTGAAGVGGSSGVGAEAESGAPAAGTPSDSLAK